jgi:hypothetical protein
MNNGTSSAVLIRDLFSADGPFIDVADDFVALRCGFCGRAADGDARFTADGFWCSTCAAALAVSVK